MNTNTRLRSWHIQLVDGRVVDVHGRKVVVSDAGALLILDGPEPRHLFAVGGWVECYELPSESDILRSAS